MQLPRLLSYAASVLLCACTITPLAPIPRPLPKALDWAAAPQPSAGAFLGLKTRENMGGGFDDLEFRPGIKVIRVVENSPAAQAGLQVGDVLLEFDGVLLDDPATLEALLAKAQPSATPQIDVQRGDSVFAVPVLLGTPIGKNRREQPAAKVSYRLDPSRSRAAWATGRGGVVLVASHERAPFVRAGIEVGSVVLSIDADEMHSDRALIRCLQAREPGSRVVVRYADAEGKERQTSVRLQTRARRLTEFSIPILGTYRASAEGDEASFVLLDFWFISLFRYQREGTERNLSILRFLSFQSGIGELDE